MVKRVVVYRKRVRHQTAKNHRLDLFDPDDGYFKYSAIVTNKEVTVRTPWFFICGCGAHEKVSGELNGGFAFNLTRAMQAGIPERRPTNRKRRASRPFQTISALRYGFINRAGLLVPPGGCQIIDVGDNLMVRDRFKTIESALAT